MKALPRVVLVVLLAVAYFWLRTEPAWQLARWLFGLE